MKIGVSSLSIYKENLSKNLEFIERLGVDYFEILNEYPNDIIDINLLNSYDFKFIIHSPIIDVNLSSLNKSIQKTSIKEIMKSIEIANELDSDIVVVHPGNIPFLSRPFEKNVLAKCRESLKICGDYGKDFGVTTAIENMPNIEGFLYQDIAKLDELLQELEMYMTLDIGHAATAGYSEDGIYFESVKHIHLSDNNHDYDMHLPLGEGSIDFKTSIDIFKEKNYDGIYTIEVNDKESVVKSLKYLENL